MVARRLAEKFLERLIFLSKEKHYSARMGCLAEILDWSQEFYDKYYDKIINWETFKCSSDNIYEGITHDGLIVAFGEERLKKFYYQHVNHATYFTEKYSAIRVWKIIVVFM